jgi:5'-3' exonuclease
MMATFSPQNAKYLPLQWQPLILDEESPISDYYPRNFTVDPNGKYHASNYVALLPFIDAKRLLDALKSVYSTLTVDEVKRNKRDYDRLFIHSTNSWYEQFKKLYNDDSGNQITQTNPLSISTELNEGIGGKIWPDDIEKILRIDDELKAPIADCEDISNNQVSCVKYRNFQFHDGYIFEAKLLDFVQMPKKILDYNDYRRPRDLSHIDSAQQSQHQRNFGRNQDSNRSWRGSATSYYN